MPQLTCKPDFICIGPEKTGTTWLYDNLKAHPQVYLPPVKEIRYFWERAFMPNQDIKFKLTSKHWHNRLFQRYLKKRINFYVENIEKLTSINSNIVDSFIWDLKYWSIQCADEWYISLFEDSGNRVAGDITPVYYQLPDEEINYISEILPNLKIIILLRNPIDRVWSKTKMNLCRQKNQKIESVSKTKFYAAFDKAYAQLSSYKVLLGTWSKHFEKQNIYVGYYDKLVENPSLLFDEICNFLSVDPCLFPLKKREKLSAKVNKGLSMDIPQEYFNYLSNIFIPCIEEMATLENKEPYPKQWLETIDKKLIKC